MGVLWILVLLAPGLQMAQQPRCFPIWQGFTQTWGYNHRINRLGDFVKSWPAGDSCIVHSMHAAASGSGADQAAFTQYYALVASGLLETYEGSTTLHFSGKEGAYLVDSMYMDIEMPSANDSTVAYEVLLNGMDLYTTNGAKADKIQTLDLAIDSVWRDIAQRKLWFRVRGALQFACSSAECEPLNQVVDYALDVHYLVLGGHGFHAARATYGGGRNWEKHDPNAAPLQARVALLGEARYPKASAGITGLHLQLDDEYHMLRWDSRLHPVSYANGLLLVDLCMTFVQNDPAMWDHYRERYLGHPKPPAKWVVHAQSGSMAWEMDISLLQFEEATISQASRTGKIDWSTQPGNQFHPAQAAENAVPVVH